MLPINHLQSGQIRDFLLFNHFVKPMAAGVMVMCIMDCCHSGAILDFPYSFQPTPAGTICMRQDICPLSNLAFLYILAGGIMPTGFENVMDTIEEAFDGDLDAYQGTSIKEMPEADMTDYGNFMDNFTGNNMAGSNGYGDNIVGSDYGYGDGGFGAPNAVHDMPVV